VKNGFRIGTGGSSMTGRAWKISVLACLLFASPAAAQSFDAIGTALLSLLTSPPIDFAIGAGLMAVVWFLSARRSRRNLAESEARLVTVMEASPDGILVHQDEKIVYANHRMAEMLGYDSADDLLGLGALDFLPPGEREISAERRARRERGEDVGLAEGEVMGRDGRRVFSERSGALTTWRGRRAHILIVRDISARKAADEVRERLLGALDQLPYSVALFDKDERLVGWNSRFANAPGGMKSVIRRGVTMEDILRARVIHDDAPEGVKASPEAADAWVAERMDLFRNVSGPIEMFIRGDWRQVRNEKLPDGGTVLISTDITDLKAREQELRASEARFRSVFENSGIGIVLTEENVGYVAANHAFCDFVGYEEHELTGMHTVDLAMPDDRPRIAARITQLLNG
jgi:PAS domain S-box-containing protein